jgi:hypothetical protein
MKKWKPENGMDDAFWKEWDENSDMFTRIEMLQKLDRLTFDHAISWIENARERGKREGKIRGE